MIAGAIAALLLIADHATAPSPPPQFGALEGAWVVDLSVKADEPYTQPMVLTIDSERSITGEFYNSTITSGRAGRNKGRYCVSFSTSDGVGPYYHAACLNDGQMVGQSWAEHRQLLLPWTAKRATAP